MVIPTFAKYVSYMRDKLLKSGLSESSASLEAKELLCFAAGIDRAKYYAHINDLLSSDLENEIKLLLERRLNGEPLAYILGEWDFYGRKFFVNKNVLIPRDDSVATLTLFLEELLSSFSIKNGNKEINIADLCSGSGCLGISACLELMSENLTVQCTLADISKSALSLSQNNIELYKLQSHIATLQLDVLSGLSELTQTGKYFDGIICNPPYIKTEDISGLDDSVKNYEPIPALDGGSDGLLFYQSIAESALKILKPGGVLCFEMGADQCSDIEKILRASEYVNIKKNLDLSGNVRAICARRPCQDTTQL